MNKKTKVLVVGCSYAVGCGLELERNDPRLWSNQLFPTADITNAGKTGANNNWIFLETISQLRKQHYDIVLVAWSAIPRYNFQVGLELYSVSTRLRNSRDINLNSNVTISGKWLNSIGNNLDKIHNDHWDLLELIKYVNTLIELQVKSRQGKLVFVNSLGPWCNNYFEYKNIQLPSDLDTYVQCLLEVDKRDDKDIFDLYNMIHLQYDEYGGIQEKYWLNLYNSLGAQQVDCASETDKHPGYQSQQVYTNYLTPILHKKLNETSNHSDPR
jgi:hypothetical protein